MSKPAAAWTARVMTLFPEMFPGPLGHSLAGRALENGLWRLETVDIREFARDKHRTVDDAPFGGGPGMVMRADVLGAAIDATMAEAAAETVPEPMSETVSGEAGSEAEMPLIYLSPRGRPADQALVRRLASGRGLALICGRFEGVDERVLAARDVVEVSIGDFVLSGGEPAAIVLIDAIVRLLPGVVGDPAALAEESFSRGLLEYPQYTRPQTWEGRDVPDVLLSGHHERIRDWRQRQAEALTKTRRRDLWARYAADE